MAESRPTLAIIGGTGAEGSGLAKRWAAAGYLVLIGSRDAERAQGKADELNKALVGQEEAVPARGLANEEAAAQAEIIVVTVPYSAHASTLGALKEMVQGKIVVDCTVPLKPPKVTRVSLPEAGSAAMEAQQLLGERVRVVSAFQNVSAELLDDLRATVNCDVLITGNDPEARAAVVQLAEAGGMVGIHAGTLENAAAAEALTSLLIFINKQYKTHGAGIRITNLPKV
ncbi:MAG: NADPH-dependent F420 reductase [Ardenticatenales bacterium]|nr:NADPH-dependent F420 reductase [Ardenticatenales bacterium]